MNLAFHYHIPCKVTADGTIYTHGFFGLFVDSIAAQSDHLYLLCYTALPAEEEGMSYIIRAKNMSFINLGPHSSVPSRLFRSFKTASVINAVLKKSDRLLLRAPTPAILMLPLIRPVSKVRIYLVGSYVEGLDTLDFNPLKNLLIKMLGYSVEFFQRFYIRNRPFLSNSQLLLEQFSKYSDKGALVKSTTLSQHDFLEESFKPDGSKPVKVLFTGRLDESKGIYDILEACEILSAQGMNMEFHFAGLILKGKETLPRQVIDKASSGLMKNKVFYHGLKAVGKELNELYRSCDIYVCASKNDSEGFPRVIWEAMANSLPVIATRVGSIPHFLQDGKEALLMAHSNPQELADRIMQLYRDPELANELIRNALTLAKDNTLEGQAKKLVKILSDYE